MTQDHVYPEGIDVSSHNGSIAHALLGCAFAFARASIGNGFDGTYAANLLAMQAAGVVTGAYHYATFGPGPTRQAALFLRHAADAEVLAIDAESSLLRHPATIRAIVVNVRRLDTRRRPILLYSSEGTWPGDMTQDANWIANWIQKPRIPWLFWQYRGSTLDRDRFNGSVAELHRFAGRV